MTPIRLCLEPRCGNKSTGRGRCDEHRKQRERERSETRRRKALTGERTPDAVKIYHSQKWLNTRKAVLSRDPICRVCNDALSTQVDHIKPLSQGGDPYALENLQGICTSCHAAKSGRESAQTGRE
jgi:5-methylcytosine-specific restriction endonuclease McrA